MKRNNLRIEFIDRGAETRLEVATPKTPEYVAALTESLRLTNIRAKLQFTVRKPEQWLAQIRLSELDGSALTPSRAAELLRVFESHLVPAQNDECKAA